MLVVQRCTTSVYADDALGYLPAQNDSSVPIQSAKPLSSRQVGYYPVDTRAAR
jgi:hypothetical protein